MRGCLIDKTVSVFWVQGRKMCAWAFGPGVQVFASVATMGMAIIAWKTLDVNIVQRNEIEEMHRACQAIAIDLTNSLLRVELYGNILAAEGGDRSAYIRVLGRLNKMTNSLDMASRADFLSRRLYETNRRFSGRPHKNEELLSIMFSDEMIENDDQVVVKKLNSVLHEDRLCAVHSIYWRRNYKFFPELIKLAGQDPDMNVVQYTLYAMLRILKDPELTKEEEDCDADDYVVMNDFLVGSQRYRSLFEELWNEKKDALLSVNPLVLERINFSDDRYLPMPYLHDEKDNAYFCFPTKEDDRLIPLTFCHNQGDGR